MSILVALAIVFSPVVPFVFGGGPGGVVHSADTVLGGPGIVGTPSNPPATDNTVLGGPG
jgi:hypothetical protein